MGLVNEKKVNLLEELVLMRPICIISIVIAHAFAIYSGVWEKPMLLIDISCYRYFNYIFVSFQLPAFVFISGYLFEFSLSKNKHESLWTFIKKKMSRLILPSIIWGILYMLLYEQKSDWNFIRLLSGPGHLWFLPMLFWNYIFIYLLRSLNLTLKVTFIGLLVILPLFFFINLLHLPFGVSNAAYYFPYILMGSIVFRIQDKLKFKYYWTIIGGVGYVLFMYMYFAKLSGCNIDMLLKYFIGVLGIMFFWSICMLTRRFVNYIWIDLHNKAFGIYLVHQFILVYLYYYTGWIYKINAYLVPFLALIITLSSSYLLVLILMHTRIKRYIL